MESTNSQLEAVEIFMRTLSWLVFPGVLSLVMLPPS